MKKQYLILISCLFVLSWMNQLNAQTANIEASPASGTTSLGPISFNGNPQVQATAFDFNSGTLPTGWSSSPYTVSGTTCVGQNSPDNSAYFWATSLDPTTSKRFVETNAIDVSDGGRVEFYIRYAADENTTICEDPDAASEEVILQYSLDDGSTWITIYDAWETSSAKDLAWYNWYWNSIAIPAGAQTTSTKFRWYQAANSGDNYDNWGLEDISIGAAVQVTSNTWKIDGDTKSTEASTFAYTFPSAGSYTVDYSFTSDKGNATDQITYVVNSVPTINAVANQNSYVGYGSQNVSLSGIGDGGIEGQTISVSATSSNTAVVSTPTVTYTSANTTGTLSYAPLSVGTSTITVTVSYTNVQTVSQTISFTVTVLPLKYRSSVDGIWETNSSWQQYNESTSGWENASSYPGEITSYNSTIVTIQNTHTITIGSTINLSVNQLIMEGSAKIIKPNDAKLTVVGNLNMSQTTAGNGIVIQ